MKDFDSEKRTVEEKRTEIQNNILERKKQLKVHFYTESQRFIQCS